MPAVSQESFAIHLRPSDNIAVAAKPIPGGTAVQIDERIVTVSAPIRLGHKFAIKPIKEGDAILKYGQIIGFAGRDIAAGEHVHTHNVVLGKFDRDYAYCSETPKPLPPPAEYRSFMGYDRGPGRPDHLRYGTRNYIAVISTVNCSAATSKYVAEKIRASGVLEKFPNVDGIVPIVHKHGCAMAYDGEDH
jgi:altronate hydrolase